MRGKAKDRMKDAEVSLAGAEDAGCYVRRTI